MIRAGFAAVRCLRWGLAAFVALLVCACGRSQPPEPATPTRVVNVFNWPDYLAPGLLEQFEAETGIEVNYDTFDSAEMLETKLLLGNSGYDVVVPTGNFLPRQVAAGVYRPLERDRLRHYANLDPQMMATLAATDPGNVHAVGYHWGTTGIGYDARKVAAALPDAPTDSWRLVFDPAVASRLADCGLVFVDAPRTGSGCASGPGRPRISIDMETKMKNPRRFLPRVLRVTVTAAMLLAVADVRAQQHEHAHDPQTAAVAGLALDGDRKWPTDASLRTGMAAVHEAFEADHPAIHAGTATDAQYRALADRIDAQVRSIVANCKLPPAADANLHLVIADLLQGVSLMRGEDPKRSRHDGAALVHGALRAYGTYFDDPGFAP